MSGVSLKTLSPAEYYKDMLRFSNGGQGVRASTTPIYDGDGVALPIEVSPSAVKINANTSVLSLAVAGRANIGTGEWNTGPLVLGSEYTVWVGTNGNLRYKLTAPTSADDGQPVGADASVILREAVDGTTSLPGFAFLNETATGFRRSASGEISVVSNGADALVLLAATTAQAEVGSASSRIMTPQLTRAAVLTQAVSAAASVGRQLFTAETQVSARSAIGATSIGNSLIIAVDSSAARTALGATAAGTALFTAADVTAQRSALGLGSASLLNSTSVGTAVITAADAAAARSVTGAAPIPALVGVGTWQYIFASAASPLVLPAGGTWAWFFLSFNTSTSLWGGVYNAGISAGGTTIAVGVTNIAYVGFAWRTS